jgi:organic hydroperoxide reductase OsmC/OhrA
MGSAVKRGGNVHHYASSLRWDGSTGAGYEAYSREHRVVVPPSRIELAVSADPVFRGEASVLNPEQLLLVAASSGQLLEFLALPARPRVNVVSYVDEASATLDLGARPALIGEIRLSPSIMVASGADLVRVERLVHKAQRPRRRRHRERVRTAPTPGARNSPERHFVAGRRGSCPLGRRAGRFGS